MPLFPSRETTYGLLLLFFFLLLAIVGCQALYLNVDFFKTLHSADLKKRNNKSITRMFSCKGNINTDTMFMKIMVLGVALGCLTIVLVNNWCIWKANVIWTTSLAVRWNNWMPVFHSIEIYCLVKKGNAGATGGEAQRWAMLWGTPQAETGCCLWGRTRVYEFQSFGLHVSLISADFLPGDYYGFALWIVVLCFLKKYIIITEQHNK